MEWMLQEFVRTCADGDWADTLLFRLLSFDKTPEEIHGFRVLSHINTDDYKEVLRSGSVTALYDEQVSDIAEPLTRNGSRQPVN